MKLGMQWLPRTAIGAVSAIVLSGCASTVTPKQENVTVERARNLKPSELASELLGRRIGAHVIEAVRHEYESSGKIPRDVQFYTQPVLTWPRSNGICRTDVISIEYDWFEHDVVQPSTVLNIFRVEASSRYKAFPIPAGDPASPESERAQAKACASMKSATDAFMAPSAGDAQWLDPIQQEYVASSAVRRFKLSCAGAEGSSCEHATKALPKLMLKLADKVDLVSCPLDKSDDQVTYCYKITFPYSGSNDPEWVLTIVGAKRDGMAPVRIRSLHAEHVEKPLVLY